MTELARAQADGGLFQPARETPVLDIVIPVYNEEHDLPACVTQLHRYLAEQVPYATRITVADNASTDSTLEVARRLAAELPGVDVIHLDRKGRGGALYTAWMASRPPWWLIWTSTSRPTSRR